MEPSNGRGAEAGARAREDAREERAPFVGKFGRADWDAADDGEKGAGTSDAKARDGGGNVDRSVARRRADAEGGDTATSSESEVESEGELEDEGEVIESDEEMADAAEPDEEFAAEPSPAPARRATRGRARPANSSSVAARHSRTRFSKLETRRARWFWRSITITVLKPAAASASASAAGVERLARGPPRCCGLMCVSAALLLRFALPTHARSAAAERPPSAKPSLRPRQ